MLSAPMIRFFLILFLTSVAALAAATPPHFDVDYRVAFLPGEGKAKVTIRITPDDAKVSRLVFEMPESRYTQIEGDGEIKRNKDRLRWEPPSKGGTLTYLYRIKKKRKSGAYDAYINSEWAVVRGDNLVPSARITATRGARSRASLHLELPEGWTHADTPWLPTHDHTGYTVVNTERALTRPTGWIIAGKIGTRRDVVEGMEIAVAAPAGLSIARMDLMAMLTATAPILLDAFGQLPEKILVVRAGEPMWRGGLSGPRSLWMHADRPLISENGSSTLMHEVVHVVTRIRGVEGDDWIAEGVAEYYGIEILRRAGLLSEARRDKAIAWMRRHGRKVTSLGHDQSSGKRTARAVALLADLDAEIRKQTHDQETLDPVIRDLMRDGRRVSTQDLREAAEKVLGHPSNALATPLLD